MILRLIPTFFVLVLAFDAWDFAMEKAKRDVSHPNYNKRVNGGTFLVLLMLIVVLSSIWVKS